MRLLYVTDDGKLEFTKDIILMEKIPPYAILSHTWGEHEVAFNDIKSLDSMKNADAMKKDGWEKIDFCAQQAKRDGLEHFWVDTCCIDKANHTELSEAINSMFRWYQKAKKCYVFLSDVEGKSSEGNGKSSSSWKAAFRASRWFNRGWTLQELLAPGSVEFFSKDGALLGGKESLKQTIHEVTGLPMEALSGSDMTTFDIDTRFSWAQHRQTTREEDAAYCLLGILGCHLPLIYGEGRERAMKRLRKEALEASQDVAGALANGTKTRSQSQKERLSKIGGWLSAPDPSTNYHKAHKQRQAKTGLWLLESEKFKSWKEDTVSQLWLYGIPGCGKTILSSTVIEHLLEHCHDDSRKVTVYFYFDFNDAPKQDPELMLRSLLCQLLQRSIAIPKSVNALFSSCSDGQRQPSLQALLKVARQVMQQFTHVYIVLDALDECSKLQELMRMLETVAGWQLDVVHLLMTSRRKYDIERSLKTYIQENDSICLQMDKVDKDISRYIQQRLRDDEHLAKWNKDAVIRQEIETALMRGAQGMFRWAVCQLDTLAKCRNLATLRKSLATLPQTLDQTYDRILTAISEQDCVYAMRILRWLTFATRPLSVEEVAEVVAIDVTREPAFDRDEVLVDPLEALDICSSLVTIVTTKDIFQPTRREIVLAHYSVQEYLVSDRIKQGPAKQYSMQKAECQRVITEGCLGYLNQFQQPVTRGLLEQAALAMYSAVAWSSHFQQMGDEVEETNRLAMDLLTTQNPAYFTWIRLWNPEDPYKELDLQEGLESIATPLYYGALLGLNKIAKLLLDQGAIVNNRSGHFGNALQAASVSGHKAMVELLIDAGADVNAPGGYYGNALQAASAEGHTDIVNILLDAHAAVNMQGGCYSNALHAAAEGAHEYTVKTLLERGADVGPDNRLKSAMHHAVNNAWCTPSLVSMLQQFGAPLDTIDTDNMTPLHYCAEFNHMDIAEQLIDAGVSIDSRVRRHVWPSRIDKPNPGEVDAMLAGSRSTSIGLTPLHYAALSSKDSMTKFFLRHGADPNARSEYGETPLHLVLRSTVFGTDLEDDWNLWRPEILRSFAVARRNVIDALVADPRIVLTAKDVTGETPLGCIPYGTPGCAALVRVLVSRGADLLDVNLSRQTALHHASKAGDYASVQALLSLGASVTSTDVNGLNALHYAAKGGNLDTMIVILEIGGGSAVKLIASKDAYGQNVLHHVLSRHIPLAKDIDKQVEMVRWLLDQGADGSELDEHGISPLARFILNHVGEINVEICQLLFAIEGNASFVDDNGQTLGHLWAAKPSFGVNVLGILNAYNVDLAKKDCDGRTVLHCSAIAGSLDELSLEFLVNTIGIGISEEDKDGRTALDHAMQAAAGNCEPHEWDSERWERTTNILLDYQ